jgi:membrane protein DedA with SNARE-associated domain
MPEMGIITAIGDWLKMLSEELPLEVFVIVGGFIEELIGPIPSPLVLTLAGSIAATREHTFWYIILLAMLGSGGKVAAAWILYVLGDKAEYWIVGKWGQVLGLSHEKVRGWSKAFNGGWWDDALLIFLRAVPILPAAPISVLCGVLKINLRTYLMSTFIGYTFRNLFFLTVGYLGVDAYKAIADEVDASEAILTIVLTLAVLGALAWLYYDQRQIRWWRKRWSQLIQLLSKVIAFLTGKK